MRRCVRSLTRGLLAAGLGGLLASQALAVPVITQVTPARGAPGTSVVIQGTDFGGVKEVKFNHVPAVFELRSAGEIVTTVPLEATTGPVSVTGTGGSASTAGSFQVAPRLTALTPARGPVGATILLEGANFTGTTNVLFGGLAAAFTVTSDSQISATVPASATNAPVTVQSAAGSAASATPFVVSSAGVIDALEPALGAYGSLVTIRGANLAGVTEVKFNGVSALFAPTGANGTQLQAQVPNTATTGRLTLTQGTNTITSPVDFVTGPGPIITGFTPASGAAGSATTVLITGINFSGATAVHFNGVAATAGAITSDSQIQVTQIPAGATTGPLSVTRGAHTGTSTNAFVIGQVPRITELNRTAGAIGEDVYLSGENLFAGVTDIRFNGTAVTSAQQTGAGGSQVRVFIPTGATSGLISVANQVPPGSGTWVTNHSAEVFFVNNGSPVILGFEPENGPVGATITIKGFNFTGASAVRFNGIPAVNPVVTSVTGTNQISAVVPAGATTGRLQVTVGAATATSPGDFYVWPRITGFGPTNGIAGASITLTGANFTAATTVRFGAIPAAFTVNSSTEISAVVPTLARTDTLSVTTPAGIVATTTNFHVLPRLSAFAPTAASPGASVELFGSGFFNVQAVRFNGVNATFNVQSVTNLTAVVPATADTGFLTVVTAEGTNTADTAFVVLPGLTDFSPKAGPSGSAVVLTGVRFGSVTSVRFNGVDAGFTLDSPTQITATVPNTATGPITLLAPGGSVASAQPFEVLPLLYAFTLPNGDVLLSWFANASGYVLQSASSLAPPIAWTDDEGTVVIVGDQKRVTLTPTPGEPQKFYRLTRPAP